MPNPIPHFTARQVIARIIEANLKRKPEAVAAMVLGGFEDLGWVIVEGDTMETGDEE